MPLNIYAVIVYVNASVWFRSANTSASIMMVLSFLLCMQGVSAAKSAQDIMKSSRLATLVALLPALLCAGVVDASTRVLLATNVIEDVSVPYNAAIVGTDPLNQLSFSDPRVQRTVSGLAPEQVRQRLQTCRSSGQRDCAYVW